MVLYGVIGNREGAFIGVTALLAPGGDGKRNIAFLLETVFFLGWLGFFSRAAPNRVARFSIRLSTHRAIPAIVVLYVYYNYSR